MKRSTKNKIAVAVCFVLCALHFTDVSITILIGIMAWATYRIVWRRDKRVVLLTVSCIVSLVAFQYFGGMVIRRQISQGYRADVDHRMKPDAAKGINSDGIRCAVEASDFTDKIFNVIVLGDSFVYGEGLKDARDTLTAQLEEMLGRENRNPRVRVVNFGWTSASPLLEHRLLKDIGAKYKPGLVVLCLDLTDFRDDLEYQLGKEFVGASPMEVLARTLRVQDAYVSMRERWALEHLWDRWMHGSEIIPRKRFFIVQQPVADSLPYVRPLERNVQAIAEHVTKELGAKFVLILLPRSFQYNAKECPKNWEAREYGVMPSHAMEPFAWLDDFRSRAAFPCYSLLDDFKQTTVFPTCFEDDPHWNREGCRVAAEGIRRVLEKENALP